MEKRRTFRTERELFHADTCEPLKRAAASGGLRLEAISRGGYPGTRLPGNELKERHGLTPSEHRKSKGGDV